MIILGYNFDSKFTKKRFAQCRESQQGESVTIFVTRKLFDATCVRIVFWKKKIPASEM